MKRIAIAVTAAVVLAAAGSAFAAATVNTYSAKYSFSGKKGTAKKPAKLSFIQNIKVTPGTPGNRTGILHKITSTIYGVRINAKGFPTCTAARIAHGGKGYDASCPKKALVATGYIKATLGDPKNFASPGAACDPALHVYNSGPGHLVFFFVDNHSHQCLGGSLQTGAVAPYPGTYKQAGKNLKVVIPIPNTVDYPLGQSGGLVGSLSMEHLKWISQSKGKKHDIMSVGCKGKKRPYSYTFNASIPGQAAQNKTVKGKAACG